MNKFEINDYAIVNENFDNNENSIHIGKLVKITSLRDSEEFPYRIDCGNDEIIVKETELNEVPEGKLGDYLKLKDLKELLINGDSMKVIRFNFHKDTVTVKSPYNGKIDVKLKHIEEAKTEINIGGKDDMTSKVDMVNHPPHYSGKIETIDFMQDKLTPQELNGFLKGNILKYISRANKKNGVEDLKKAQWYLNKLVEVNK